MRPASHRTGRWSFSLASALILGTLLVVCDGSHAVAPPGPCRADVWVPSMHSWPSWSPDGERLAFMSARDSAGRYAPGIYVVDLESRRTEQVDPLAGHFLDWVDQIAWSPDGGRLLVRRSGRFWIVDLPDRSWVRVPTDPSRLHWDAAWSPGGDSIFYRREYSNLEPLTMGGAYVVNLRTREITRFAYQDTGLVWNMGPIAFSPDGRSAVYSDGIRREDGLSHALELFIVDMVTKVRRQITWLDGEAANPMWIEDGRAITFDFVGKDCQYVGSAIRQSWRVRPDGTGLEPLRHDLGGNSVQFGWPAAIDRRGRRAAFVGHDRRINYGVLHVTDIHRFDPRPVYDWQGVQLW
jgi:Tol biopolymer transport system component